MTDSHSGRAARSQVGRSVPRLESHAKVTGRAEYIHNLRVPGMLHATVVRSTVAHGRITRIDAETAAGMPGVIAVITGQDVQQVIPEPYYGPAFHDQPILALDKARYIGEPVAAVLAEDPHLAETAAQEVVVDYHELPAVFDEVEAMTCEAIVHEALRPAGAFADLKHLAGRTGTNVALDFHLTRGDPEQAFANAARVFDHTFRTQQAMHTPFEPFVAVAEIGGGHATIHTSTQSPSFVRYEIARLLGMAENQVRVRTAHLGGGFGAKVYVKVEALACALAMISRRPVRVALSMEEQFFTISKHPCTFRIQSAVDSEGNLTGRRCEVWWNGGAYADIGPRVTQKSGFTAAGPYDIDNVQIDSYAVYTNRPPAGALRGFGIPQLVWAYESHTDLIARELGVDRLEFRRRTLLREGRPQAVGTPIRDAFFVECVERAAQKLGWGNTFDRGSGTVRRGRGVAVGFKASISPTTSVAMVNINADGSCLVHCSTVDMGQGSDTAMAQITAEVLGIEAETVRIIRPDTDVTPYDMSTLGSRSTFHMGHAVRLAAEDARDKLAQMTRDLGLPESSNLPVPEIFIRRFGMRAGNIVGVGTYKPDYEPPDPETGQSANATPFWMVGACGAEVAVDTETGHLRIERLVSVCDVGRPLNPAIVETQISGAAIMQLGFTLTEDMALDEGQVTNASLADYKIPGFFDLPVAMESDIVPARQSNGPFGAKGIGESGTFALSPAIANALDDAVGVRLTDLPITPEAVLRALRAAQGKALADH